MSDSAYETLAAQIAAGTITAEEILAYDCAVLTNNEKLALLVALGDKLVQEGIPSKQSSVLSGLVTGADTLEVPNFLTGRIQIVDTDDTGRDDLEPPHQFVTDTEGDSYPESSIMEWGGVPGEYFAGRTFTVPAGTKMLYTFVLHAV